MRSDCVLAFRARMSLRSRGSDTRTVTALRAAMLHLRMTITARCHTYSGSSVGATAVSEAVQPLYASFTEGFGTRDLVEAKALLEKLG